MSKPKARAQKDLHRPMAESGPLAPSDLGKASQKGTEALKPAVTVKPRITQLLHDAYHLLAEELENLKAKQAEGHHLGPAEANQLTKYIDSMTRLAREEREQEKRNDPGNFSDAELKEMLPDILEYLGYDAETVIEALQKGQK